MVERARTARRFIKLTSPPYAIEDLSIIEIDKKGRDYLNGVKAWMKAGHSVGLISESGMPGIADPGSEVVQLAYRNRLVVKPLVGPSSLFLAMAASGLNGQSFCFIGYLPIKENELKAKLKCLEVDVLKNKQTQIFIETPYRNDRLLKTLTTSLNKNILLCIAKDITGESEFIQTQSIADWKKNPIIIGKFPTIFIIG